MGPTTDETEQDQVELHYARSLLTIQQRGRTIMFATYERRFVAATRARSTHGATLDGTLAWPAPDGKPDAGNP